MMSIVTTRTERGEAYVSKAVRMLEWAESWIAEMRDHGSQGRMREVERTLFAALIALGSAHEALLSAASCISAKGLHGLLQQLRESDPLLRYLWLARDAEVHSEVLKWEAAGRNIQICVVDPAKARYVYNIFWHPLYPDRHSEMMFRYLYGVHTEHELLERTRVDPAPIPERLASAGVTLSFAVESLVFRDFVLQRKGRDLHVAAPRFHLGKPMSAVADHALEKAMKFYQGRAADLHALLTATNIASDGQAST